MILQYHQEAIKRERETKHLLDEFVDKINSDGLTLLFYDSLSLNVSQNYTLRRSNPKWFPVSVFSAF